MPKKFFSLVSSAVLLLAGLVAAPAAQAVGTGGTGSIYYVGSWIGPDWQGIRRLDLASGEDARLDLNSPTCAGLAGSSTSGLAVDLTRKRLYWTANDGTTGVFAMDLTLGECYTIEANTSAKGVVVSADGQSIVWSVRAFNFNTGLFQQELHTIDVTSLPAIANGTFVSGSQVVEFPGYQDVSISDLEMHNGRMYALMNLTDVNDLSTRNFIYSYDPTSLADPAVLESETGVIGTPYQFQIGANAYYVSTADQIYKIDFGSQGASWGMMLNQISGFALVGDNIYSAFNRDEPMKVFNPNTDQNPRAIPSNPPVDMFSYLVYAPPMTVPTISAASADSSAGSVDVPFTGVTPGTNEIIGYSIVPRDGSAPFGGLCAIVGSSCRITGLDDTKLYDVTLRFAYTYTDPNDPAHPTHVIMASGPSNSAQINHDPVVPPVTPTAKKSVKTVTGFEFERGALTSATKRDIRAWLAGKTGFTKVTCIGYTGYNWNNRSKAYLTKLALARATNVCNYIHTLKPSIVVKSKTAKRDTSYKNAARRVIATISN